jgi:hypothetical protein
MILPPVQDLLFALCATGLGFALGHLLGTRRPRVRLDVWGPEDGYGEEGERPPA